MIIDRYIVSEIAKPFAVAVVSLASIFVAYSAIRLLNDVVAGEFAFRDVAILVLLQTLIGMEALLPTALYLSVVSALARMHRDSEVVALSALGVSHWQMLRGVFLTSVVVAGVVAYLSLFGRPWAYQVSYALEEHAVMSLDLDRFQAGQFHSLGDGNLVMNYDRIDIPARRVFGVFVQSDTKSGRRVIYAKEAILLSGEPEPRVRFLDGYAYESRSGKTDDRVLKFKQLTIAANRKPPSRIGNKRKAAATRVLATAPTPKEIAEYQWRLSIPFATLLLGMLGLPLSKTTPRQGRHRSIVLAILVYAVFFNLSSVARTWVERGTVGPVPGIWWVHGLLAVLLLSLFVWRARH